MFEIKLMNGFKLCGVDALSDLLGGHLLPVVIVGHQEDLVLGEPDVLRDGLAFVVLAELTGGIEEERLTRLGRSRSRCRCRVVCRFYTCPRTYWTKRPTPLLHVVVPVVGADSFLHIFAVLPDVPSQ